MSEHFELLDIYKAVISLAAGVILGLEREMKDKSAGLKPSLSSVWVLPYFQYSLINWPVLVIQPGLQVI